MTPLNHNYKNETYKSPTISTAYIFIVYSSVNNYGYSNVITLVLRADVYIFLKLIEYHGRPVRFVVMLYLQLLNRYFINKKHSFV